MKNGAKKQALQLRENLIDFRDQTREQLNQVKDQGQLKRSEIADLFQNGKIKEGMQSLPPKHCSALNIYPLLWAKTPEERQQLIKAGYPKGDKFTQFLKREEAIASPSP